MGSAAAGALASSRRDLPGPHPLRQSRSRHRPRWILLPGGRRGESCFSLAAFLQAGACTSICFTSWPLWCGSSSGTEAADAWQGHRHAHTSDLHPAFPPLMLGVITRPRRRSPAGSARRSCSLITYRQASPEGLGIQPDHHLGISCRSGRRRRDRDPGRRPGSPRWPIGADRFPGRLHRSGLPPRSRSLFHHGGGARHGIGLRGMGAAREATFACLAERPSCWAVGAGPRIRIVVFVVDAGSSMPLAWTRAGASFVLVATALFIVLLAENSRIPVDDPNTHLELTMIHEVMVLDHGGPALVSSSTARRSSSSSSPP